MKILVTGGSGMLGSEVVKVLLRKGHSVVAPTHEEMDITDQASVDRVFDREQPNAVIHCAAWTKVDAAESHPAECTQVNGLGTARVAQAAVSCGAKLVYVSTDYVFGNGTPGVPHELKETPAPLNVYGLSKLQGELAVRSLMQRYFIVRAGWLYTPEKPCFMQTILEHARAGEKLTVVNDQVGAPTLVHDLALALAQLVQTENYGYHAAVPDGSCSWYEFAQAILDEEGVRAKVVPVTSDSWHAPAKRPACSLIVPTIKLPDWRLSLRNAVKHG